MIDYDLFNSNIAQVETIISSNYHFRFIDLSGDDIGNYDMMMSIVQARVITEGICRFIVLQEHLVKDERSLRAATLKVYVDDLLRPNLIVPKPIISYLTTIQEKSNLTVHYQTEGNLDLKQTIMCLESLESVIAWFIKRYSEASSGLNKWKISSDMLNKSGAVPEKAEGCIISRQHEVEEIRRKLNTSKVLFIRGYSGIGKTEIAKDYARKYRKKYDRIYYTENVSEINRFIYDLPIGIIDEDQKTQEEIIQEKLDVIHSLESSYLFILDNYSGKQEDLQSVYPDDKDKYHLLILVDDEYKIDNSVNYYNAKAFSEEESLQVFRYFCEGKYADDEIMTLLSYLEYNPGAIKMSAVFLRDNDNYDPGRLINSMQRYTSVKSMMQNLYLALTEVSILEKDERIKQIAECLSLIPYNGVSKERFIELLCKTDQSKEYKEYVNESIAELEKAGWVNLDKGGFISINPLLSDTVFEKTRPDMTSSRIVKFLSPILQPIGDIREMFLSQVLALEPFVEHLTKRVKSSPNCDLSLLNSLREYYIAVYNLPKVAYITERMEREFNKYHLNDTNLVENTIYSQGIVRFSLEDFQESHACFSRAIEMLDKKMIDVEITLAKICAYEGASLAAIGKKEKAIKCVKRSIDIREKLGRAGNLSEKKKLWISHYNYAKVLMFLGRYNEAYKEINTAEFIYKKYYPIKYCKKKSTNVSSLFQLKGRICAGLGNYDEAIKLLEDAKRIRENLKGETYFSTAQVYAYLMDVYSQYGDYAHALKYARAYYNVLLTQYKTEDIKHKLREVEDKMVSFGSKLDIRILEDA